MTTLRLSLLMLLAMILPAASAPVRVLARDLVHSVVVPAVVAAPAAEAGNVAAAQAGVVRRVLVTRGMAVREGEVLAEFEDPEARARYENARQVLLRAREEYGEANRRHDASVLRAAGFAEAAASRVRRDRYWLAEARSDMAAAAPEARGAQRLRVERAADRLDRSTEELRWARAQLQERKDARAAAVAAERRALEEARAGLEAAQVQLRSAMVRAPLSAQVLGIEVAPGDSVARGQVLFRMANLSALEIRARVDPETARVARRGTPVYFTLDGRPGSTMYGQVREVRWDLAVLDQDVPDAPVLEAEFQNVDGRAKPGDSGNLVIELARAEGVLALPVSLVRRTGDGRAVVAVNTADGWQPVVVDLGLRVDDWVEVVAGVSSGAEVRAATPEEISVVSEAR